MKPFLPSLFNDTPLAQDFNQIRRQLDDLSRSFSQGWPQITGFSGVTAPSPALNVSETNQAIDITVELPGLEEKDVKVEIQGDALVISGEKKREHEEKGQSWHVVERSFGSFRRAIALPFEPKHDAVSAHFDKGVLRVEIAKPAESKPAAKAIEIKSGPAPAKPSQPANTAEPPLSKTA